MKKITLTGLILFNLCSCRSSQPISGNADSEASAIRLEESRQEYNDCVHRLEPGQPTCDGLKALYKKDEAEFENDANYN